MHYSKAAQPALLYLSPACIFAPLVCAWVNKDFKTLFEFADGEKNAAVEDTPADVRVSDSRERIYTRSQSKLGKKRN